MSRMNLSKNFTKDEFACKCGCRRYGVISFKLLIGLEKLRTLIGDKSIIINSGFRCRQHNLEKHKSKSGTHTLGLAADIKLPLGMSMKQFHDAIIQIEEFKGIGLPTNSNYIHVDTREKETKWGYNSLGKQITYTEALDILGW